MTPDRRWSKKGQMHLSAHRKKNRGQNIVQWIKNKR